MAAESPGKIELKNYKIYASFKISCNLLGNPFLDFFLALIASIRAQHTEKIMGVFQELKEKLGSKLKKFTTILVVCFIALSVLLSGLISPNSTIDLIKGLGKTNNFCSRATNVTTLVSDSENNSSQTTSILGDKLVKNDSSQLTSTSDGKLQNGSLGPGPYYKGSINGTLASTHNKGSSLDMVKDKFLGGLLGSGFDEASCFSRYQSVLYRRTSCHNPSPHLLSKLRNYEDLHKRCGPDTKSYKQALKRLSSRNRIHGNAECRYVVWLPVNGLGNRMISLASAFLYALLTNRVLLVDFRSDMAGLFCEPFPSTSWILPEHFPLKNQFGNPIVRYANSLGSLFVNASIKSPPNYRYLNLYHGNYDGDKLFYCDQGQAPLRKIQWLILLSDQYFAPSFFLLPSFRNEVTKMFPDKESIFHHLGLYLFHPSNQVWGLITRFYDAYLAKADERIGLQIRVFNPKRTPFETIMDQILQCVMKEELLPRQDRQKFVTFHSEERTSKAILVTSLFSGFSENLTKMYWMNPTTTGEVIGIYQPSHEEYQHFGDNMHNIKALAEIYLLSFSDKLVTSAWSTFGYVAQGLAGLKPWILYKTDDKNIPEPACVRDMSMEPCFHFPPTYDCEGKEVDAGDRLPYLKHCKDLNWGAKLVSDGNELYCC